jgi:hypothetical protein
MEYRHELLDEWVGGAIHLETLRGPDTEDEEEITRLWTEPDYILRSRAEASTSISLLEGYDQVGVTIRQQQEGAPRVFVPWGAVLNIMGGFEEVED